MFNKMLWDILILWHFFCTLLMKIYMSMYMHKIRLLNAKDRSRIYEIMQQDDILTAFEIDFTIEQIDNFLFENNKLKNKAIVIENDNCRVIGFGYYGPNDVIRDSFIIYRFYLSSIYDVL